MAFGTSDLIVPLSLDTTQFEGSLSKYEGQMTKLQASYPAAVFLPPLVDQTENC